MLLTAVGLLGVLVLTSCGSPTPTDVIDQGVADGVPRLRVEVLARLAHDPAAYTEGLELAGDTLFEGTGLTGSSELRALDPQTGAVRRRHALPPTVFGEGITVVDGSIWQLTWTDGIALQWDAATFTLRRQVRYHGQGWGLCYDHDAHRLVMSDGSDRLTFRDPTEFRVRSSVAVLIAGRPLTQLNELECVHGAVWANVWRTDWLVRIDPASGQVTAAVDAAGLLPARQRAGADVLNGIAALPTDGEFLLTGKLWQTTFRVRFVPS